MAIALRPGWPEDAEMSRLAKALNVRLLTQAHSPQVFTHLLHTIDPSLTPSAEVLAVQSQLQGWAQTGLAVLSDSRSLPPSAINENGLLSVSSLVKEVAVRQQRCWTLAHLPGNHLLLWVDKKFAHASPWTSTTGHALANELNALGQWRTLTDGAATLCVLLHPHPHTKSLAVQQRLAALLGQGLLNAIPNV